MTTVYASTNPTAYTKIHIYCTCVYSSNNTQHMCQCCVLLQISYTVVDVHNKVHAPADSTHTADKHGSQGHYHYSTPRQQQHHQLCLPSDSMYAKLVRQFVQQYHTVSQCCSLGGLLCNKLKRVYCPQRQSVTISGVHGCLVEPNSMLAFVICRE